MDSLTLSLVIIVFFSSLALYFATANSVVVAPPAPLPEKPPPVGLAIKIPAVLRQNVAVTRLMR